jgi:hypothetical protein
MENDPGGIFAYYPWPKRPNVLIQRSGMDGQEGFCNLFQQESVPAASGSIAGRHSHPAQAWEKMVRMSPFLKF